MSKAIKSRCIRDPAPPQTPGCWWHSAIGCPGDPPLGTKLENAGGWLQDSDSQSTASYSTCVGVAKATLEKRCFPTVNGERKITPDVVMQYNPPAAEEEAQGPTRIPHVGKKGSGRCIAKPEVASEKGGAVWTRQCPTIAMDQGTCEGTTQCKWVGTCWISQDKCATDPSKIGNFEVPYLASTGKCTPENSKVAAGPCLDAVSSLGAYDGAVVYLGLYQGPVRGNKNSMSWEGDSPQNLKKVHPGLVNLPGPWPETLIEAASGDRNVTLTLTLTSKIS